MADYKQEFPNYDDDLTPFPGLVDTSWRNDAMPSFENSLIGVRLWCDFKTPDLSSEPEISDARKRGDMKRFAIVRINENGEQVDDSELAASDDIQAIAKAYAELWIDWVATKGIGLGFHPDTPADSYEPLLGQDLRAQYDAMIEFCHQTLDDVYATGLDAWARAGLIETPNTPKA